MSRWVQALLSPIGSKAVMAITGLLLSLFVLAHMLGNLQIYLGPAAINAYAKGLKDMPALLWSARIGLLTLAVVHVGFAFRLHRQNEAARPVAYVHERTRKATWMSRHMVLTGLVILAFVVFHLLHFTVGKVVKADVFAAAHDHNGYGHDVYFMFVKGFQDPLVTGSYLVAQVFLALHLMHGFSSLFQSLGLNHPRWDPLLRKLGPGLGILILVGNGSMPLMCLLGVVKEVAP
jgi:succinate dehydrogenase / fumarate reductase cytochrome b subunit